MNAHPVHYDLEVLAALVGPDPAVLQETLDLFVTVASVWREELSTASLDEFARLGHRMKSSARSIGAFALGDRCEALELAADSGDEPAALTARSAALAALAEVTAEVEAARAA